MVSKNLHKHVLPFTLITVAGLLMTISVADYVKSSGITESGLTSALTSKVITLKTTSPMTVKIDLAN